ncbi:ATP-binding protein [Streptomyces sp. NPDC102406]|uniref:ATP-binding protein n=1 Tax=Streptomyces sp. NPDC102406 TaxID=3366171 RepID=UPI0037F7131C
MLRRSAFRLPRHPASVGVARLRVRDHLAVWGHTEPADALDTAVLLVSELATNAIRHGPAREREFEIAVTVLADGSCFIEVSDASATEPAMGPPRTPDDESGRGLHLVDALSEAWGVWHRGRYGKTVWALVRS